MPMQEHPTSHHRPAVVILSANVSADRSKSITTGKFLFPGRRSRHGTARENDRASWPKDQ